MGEQKRKSTEDAEEGEVFSEAGSMKDFRQTQPPRRSESERLERQGWKEQPKLFKDAKTRGHMVKNAAENFYSKLFKYELKKGYLEFIDKPVH